MTQLHPVQNDLTMMITTNTWQRQRIFSEPAVANEAIECLYRVQELYPFLLYAFVIMLDHCHFLLEVPAPNRVSAIMNSYKSGVTFDTGIKKMWQKRFHIRCVNNPLEAKRYIHLNPVRAGLVESMYDYPWSSACGKWDVSPLVLH